MFIFCFIALVLGIVLLKYNLIIFIILTILYFIYIILKKNKKLFILNVVFFSIGIILTNVKIYLSQNIFLNNCNYIVVKASNNYYIVDNFLSRYYVYEKNNTVEIGDLIYLEGNTIDIQNNMIEEKFNFVSYLNDMCVYKQINVKTKNIIINVPIRNKIIASNFLNQYGEDAKRIFNSLLFNSSYDQELGMIYKNSNLIFLLGISGIYISVFIRLIEFLFRLKFDEKKSFIFTAVSFLPIYMINWSYYAFIRTFFFYLFAGYLKHFKNKSGYLQNMFSFHLMLLLINPFYVYQLKFLLPLGFGLINYILNISLKNKSKRIRFFYKNIMLLLFIIPFNINLSNSINILSLILQIPYSFIFQIFFIVGQTSKLIGYNPAINLLGYIGVSMFSSLKYFELSLFIQTINIDIVIIYYILYFFELIFFEKQMFFLTKKYAICCAFFVIIYAIPIRNLTTSEVVFVNVGQGDCIFIREKNKAMMIDTGGSIFKNIAGDVLIPFLKSKMIYSLESVIITHNDYDHCGALDTLCANYNVKRVIRKDEEFPYRFGSSTLYNLNKNITGDENSQSLVIKFDFYNVKYLLMGDAPLEIEKEIIKSYDVDCDILKIGHHGSITSTCEEFIKATTPFDAIVSVGRNHYGHPDKKVLELLKSYNINIKRTDKLGSVVYTY